MDNYLLSLMCGTDIPIPQCQLVLHQPTLKEIAMLGEQKFFEGIQCICIDKSLLAQGNLLSSEVSNFQIFMTIINEKMTSDKREIVQDLCLLLFPNMKLTILPQSLLFSGNDMQISIDENNFEFIVQVLKKICCLDKTDAKQYDAANAKAKEIADKIMRGRQRIAQEKGSNNDSILSQYLSVLTVGLNSMSLQDMCNLTIFQLYDLIERYSLYINWDIDIRSRLAGGKPNKEPDNWMKNIH